MCNFRLGRHSHKSIRVAPRHGKKPHDPPWGGLPGEQRRVKRHGLPLPSLFASDLLLEKLPLRNLRSGPGGGTLQVSDLSRVAALFLRNDGSLSKFPSLGIGCGRNYEMQIPNRN
jgi:hypothetical protein